MRPQPAQTNHRIAVFVVLRGFNVPTKGLTCSGETTVVLGLQQLLSDAKSNAMPFY